MEQINLQIINPDSTDDHDFLKQYKNTIRNLQEPAGTFRNHHRPFPTNLPSYFNIFPASIEPTAQWRKGQICSFAWTLHPLLKVLATPCRGHRAHSALIRPTEGVEGSTVQINSGSDTVARRRTFCLLALVSPSRGNFWNPPNTILIGAPSKSTHPTSKSEG